MSREVVGRPMEILLVEDNLVDARYTIFALRKGQIKHRLTLVVDGEEAMEFLRHEGRFASAPRPDLILLDLELPKKDGRQVLTEIRADENLKTIPVVVMTASDSPEDMAKTEQLEVESYVTKPVDLEKFLSLVKELKRYWLKDVVLPSVD